MTVSHPPCPPVMAAWGAGVDSTAMLIEWVERGLPLDAVLFADTGAEKPETDAFVPVFQSWLRDRGVLVETVRTSLNASRTTRPIAR